MQEHTYYYEQIVIGNNLNALVYANKTNSVFINNSLDKLFPFDEIGTSVDLGAEILELDEKISESFDYLLYRMAALGQAPFSGLLSSVRVEPENNILNVITNNSRVIKCEYNKLRIFDSEKIAGLPFEDRSEVLYYRVFDWFNVRSGMKHDYDFLTSDTDFCKKIYFYISKRIDGNKTKKDLVSESIMSKEQLNDINYSDTIAKLKTISLMNSAGIRGAGNGVGKYLSLRLELKKREIMPVKKYFYEEHNNIIFDDRSLKELVESNVL